MSRTYPDLRFKHDVHVRFRDIDAGGHAHHSAALIYFEEARAAYWRDVVGAPDIGDIDYVMAQVSVRYRRRVLYPATLSVSVGVVRLGRKHFEMAYEVVGLDGQLLITGTSVQVMFDYATGATKSISSSVRARIEAQDGPFGPGGVPQLGDRAPVSGPGDSRQRN